MYQKKLHLLCLLGTLITFLCAGYVQAQEKNTEKKQDTFADRWEYVGIAVEEPGYTIWGTSPILGEDGKVHLFVARWPGELKVDPGWRTHSEIAHYVGDSPEGPFTFVDVPIKGDIEKNTLSPCNPQIRKLYAAHNPNVTKTDSSYVLLYIVNDGIERHPSNQYICMATSKSLYGPWKKAGDDGIILKASENPDYWNYQASNGVVNPAFIEHPEGGYFLYFKSHQSQMGLAIAENLEGPYVQLPFPVTANDQTIEDGYIFMHNGRFAMLTTDNHGIIEAGGGILWTSEDGIRFDKYEKGFHRINAYTDVDMDQVAVHYGAVDRSYAKFERPQLLLIDEEPKYIYMPSGTHIFGGDCTVSYVLKYKEQ